MHRMRWLVTLRKRRAEYASKESRATARGLFRPSPRCCDLCRCCRASFRNALGGCRCQFARVVCLQSLLHCGQMVCPHLCDDQRRAVSRARCQHFLHSQKERRAYRHGLSLLVRLLRAHRPCLSSRAAFGRAFPVHHGALSSVVPLHDRRAVFAHSSPAAHRSERNAYALLPAAGAYLYVSSPSACPVFLLYLAAAERCDQNRQHVYLLLFSARLHGLFCRRILFKPQELQPQRGDHALLRRHCRPSLFHHRSRRSLQSAGRAKCHLL